MNNWKAITSNNNLKDDPVVNQLLAEAMQAAPNGYTQENGPAMLPRRPFTGECAICGTTTALTKEHIPPKATGNKERTTKITLENWLKRKGIKDIATDGKVQQGGIFGYTLCRSCNSLTGRKYGSAYKKWLAEATQQLHTTADPNILDSQTEMLGTNIKFGSGEHDAIQPGALVRQVLSMMCSLSGKWDLAEQHPELREIILEGKAVELPKELDLGFVLYFGPKIRISGPQLAVNRKEKAWRWLMEIAYPPMAFLMVIASNIDDPGRGLMINEWTKIRPEEKRLFEGVTQIGFGWSPIPGEYRTSAAIENNIEW